MSEAEAVIERLFPWGCAALAPMVRCGTLPLRLQSLRYGADAVYGEEVIALKMPKAERVVDEQTGVVSFVTKGSSAFSTCAEERDRVVFQIGAPDAASALRAAEVVARDVACVDLNMGCPKKFSLQGGMGAALMRKPEAAADILSTLRRNLPLPVTCKIRVVDAGGDSRETVELVRRLEHAGAMAIGVHARTVDERPRDPAQWARLSPLADSVRVPVLANGDFWTRQDLCTLWAGSRCRGALVARGATRNPSIFRGATRRSPSLDPALHPLAPDQGPADVTGYAAPPPARRLSLWEQVRSGLRPAPADGPGLAGGTSYRRPRKTADQWARVEEGDDSLPDMLADYLRTAAAVGNHPSNTKYVLMYMLRENGLLGSSLGTALQGARGHDAFAAALGVALGAEGTAAGPGVEPLAPAQRHSEAYLAREVQQAAEEAAAGGAEAQPPAKRRRAGSGTE